MRRLIYSMGVSLDGFIAGPHGEPGTELAVGGTGLASTFMKLGLNRRVPALCQSGRAGRGPCSSKAQALAPAAFSGRSVPPDRFEIIDP
jgi:hypothetical protein